LASEKDIGRLGATAAGRVGAIVCLVVAAEVVVVVSLAWLCGVRLPQALQLVTNISETSSRRIIGVCP